MTLASGLGSQFGLAKETTWGTVVTPAKFYEFDNDSLNLDQNYNDSIGLKANRTFMPSGRMLPTWRTVNGGVPLLVPTKLFGSLLDLLHGAAVTPVQQASTAAYLQTHPIGTSLPNKSATLQLNKPDDTAADHAFTYPGSVVTSVTFSCDAGGVLSSSWTFNAKDELTPETTPAGPALASASYASGVTSWVGSGSGVSINVNGTPYAEASSWSLTITQGYKTDGDRVYLGSGGTHGKPIPNALTQVSGTIDGDFNGTTLYNLYRAGSIIDIYADFSGAIIASTYHEEIKFDASAAQIRGAGIQVPGADVLTQSLPFTCGDNGSSTPLTITYQSTDTTI